MEKHIYELADSQLTVMTDGAGPPLLVLHDEMGYPGCMAWQTELAQRRKIYLPLAPGFGMAPRMDWVSSVRDLACLYASWLRRLDLAALDVIGFSFGGWLAAEMIAGDPRLFRKAVLVAPLGIKPPLGEICDAYVLSHRKHLEATVADPARTPEFGKLYGGAPTPAQIEAFDEARAESARLAWQPYLHNPSLPHLLAAVNRPPPTLLLHGQQDHIVPPSASQAWCKALAGAQLQMLPACGHRPEIEQKEQFLLAVNNFLQ